MVEGVRAFASNTVVLLDQFDWLLIFLFITIVLVDYFPTRSSGFLNYFNLVGVFSSPKPQKPQTASSKIMDPVRFEGLSWATALVVNGDKHLTACTEETGQNNLASTRKGNIFFTGLQ